MPTPIEASFGGQQIFGRHLSMRAEPEPRAKEDQSWFGNDGGGRTDGGGRGTKIHVAGEHVGASLQALGAEQSRFRALHDGTARLLQDRDGTRWDQSVMTAFEPAAPVSYRAGSLLFTQKYSATFLSLEA